MLEAKIQITLKKTVADPQGLTIKHALESLGHQSLEEVRFGKLVTIKLKSKDKKKAKQDIKDMCQKLLTNPIIEDYSFQLKEI